MKIYFNQLGVVTSTDTTDEAIRQGNVGNRIQAYFAGKDNSVYTARMDFTRPDGTQIANIVMAPDQVVENMWECVLDDEWYCVLAGEATLTIYLYDGLGNIEASGQVLFPIEETDYEDDNTVVLTQQQYDSLLFALSRKNNVSESIVVLNVAPQDLSQYGANQIFFLRSTKKFYNIVGGNLREYNITSGIFLTPENDEYVIPEEDR